MSAVQVPGRRYTPNAFTIEQVRDFWDSVADEYAHEGESLSETHFQRFERAFRHFEPRQGMRALNCWSRNGEAVDYFRRFAPDMDLVNAEVSPRLIEKARARYPREAFIQTDLLTLPFADEEFDFVLSLETIEHAPDPLRFLREVARVLKPGGRLVLSCPPATAELPLRLYEMFLPNHGEGPHRFLRSREVKALMHAAGLALRLHEGTLFIPAGPRLLRRLEPFVERAVAGTPLSEFGVRQFFVCERPGGPGSHRKLIENVVETGLCTRCGTCVGVCGSGVLEFTDIDGKCLPAAVRPEACSGCGLCVRTCPGEHVSFCEVRAAAGDVPIQSEALGPIRRLHVAHAQDPAIRRAGASGGVVTALLCDLLDRGEINGALVLDAHPQAPWRPWPRIARSREEILSAAQSKYCVTPNNVILSDLNPAGDRLAVVALPCQIHALRTLEGLGHRAMKAVSLIIGLYCGNQLYFGATQSFLKRHGVTDLSQVQQIRYRQGDWPGQVCCQLKDGRCFETPKFAFNHLISFYVIERCLLCTDLAAEGADISVADAWGTEADPRGGWSLVVSRTQRGEAVVQGLSARGVIDATAIDLQHALAMHAHALDLKKTGGSLRVRRLAERGKPSPLYDVLSPVPSRKRRLTETLMSAHFRLFGTPLARRMLEFIPFGLLGWVYTKARGVWKTAATRKQN